MNAQQIAATLTQEATQNLIRTAQAMPDEKFTWQPLDAGRSALDQIIECGIINSWGARLLHDRAVPPMDGEAYARTKTATTTRDAAIQLLERGTAELVAAIEAFPDAHLEDTLELPFRAGMIKSFTEMLLMPYWNLTYHLGQINYIQTLYGDREMH
jgi:hypothetical protein